MVAKRYQIVLFYFLVLSFSAVATAVYLDFAVLMVVPVALAVIYFAIFHLDNLFEFIVLCTPLSINLEQLGEFGGIGFYMPTEPLLLGVTGLLIIRSLVSGRLNRSMLTHPISLALLFYLSWIFITSLTSTDIMVSMKFFVSKLWFIVPIFYFGLTYFQSTKKIKRFLWLYIGSLTLVVMYTLIRHGSHAFGEDQGHWVMSPFFKDHTSYGAVLALIFPVVVLMFFLAKDGIQKSLVGILIGIHTFGIFFSYTRAAYLSLVGALFLLGLIKYKVKFKYIGAIGVIGISMLIMNWDQIWLDLNKNKVEHTTEEFGERLQSMSNVSTDASNLERLNRWSCAVEMFQERPIFGYGPGTYAFEYAPFQHYEDLTIISTNFGTGGNAHSEYLGPLAESGLLGMISMILIVATIFYSGIKLYIKLEDPQLKLIIMACILGLFTYFAHGILNNYLDTDKASVPVWGFAAIIVATEYRMKKGLLKGDQSD
ncbi:MAG: O-antigen ligase family protein [Flavobacteriales bacterium]|nr:O-antigen ligase family protein [Flavobacteriales bacterium]